MRISTPFRLFLAGLVLAVNLTGCDDASIDKLGRTFSEGAKAPSASVPPPPVKAGDTITIATFNIQVFGTSKLSDPVVMDRLAQIVRRFDVVAIQELRSRSQNVVPAFVELINSVGANYGYEVGPRLGRTSSKEQYVYIYNTDRIELDRNSVYTIGDRSDLLHRQPLVARFRVRGPPEDQAFTFTLANLHTDPDEAEMEVDALAQAFVSVQRNGSGEDDVILLGDFNVDGRHMGRIGRLPNVDWVVSGVPTNTRKTKQYDNIVFDRAATTEYTGRWGVFDIEQEFGISRKDALRVSDHLPVWAEFSVYERNRNRIARGR